MLSPIPQEKTRIGKTLVLIDGSPEKIAHLRQAHGEIIGQLRTPLTKYRRAHQTPYALDNGCFTEFRETTWLRMVKEAYLCRASEPALFVTLPDIVGSAARTAELFDIYQDQTEGVPRALVLQDGIENQQIPWRAIDAVFIGGSDNFKISESALAAARAAKILGKWVHVGRVNTWHRLNIWFPLADSIDGTGVTLYNDSLEKIVEQINGTHPRHNQKALEI